MIAQGISRSQQDHSMNGACDQRDCRGTIFAEVLGDFRDGEAGAADDADGEIAQGRDGAGTGPRPGSGSRDTVQPVFDSPVISDEVEKALWLIEPWPILGDAA